MARVTTSFTAFAASAALSLAACHMSSASDTPASPPSTGTWAEVENPPASGPTIEGPAIATLVTNDARVTLLGRSHARITVRGADGRSVEKTMPIAELRSFDRELFDLVTGATAGGSLDARLYTHDIERAASHGKR